MSPCTTLCLLLQLIAATTKYYTDTPIELCLSCSFLKILDSSSGLSNWFVAPPKTIWGSSAPPRTFLTKPQHHVYLSLCTSRSLTAIFSRTNSQISMLFDGLFHGISLWGSRYVSNLADATRMTKHSLLEVSCLSIIHSRSLFHASSTQGLFLRQWA